MSDSSKYYGIAGAEYRLPGAGRGGQNPGRYGEVRLEGGVQGSRSRTKEGSVIIPAVEASRPGSYLPGE